MDEDDMPKQDAPPPTSLEPPTLPPGASSQEILESFLPIVLRVATESAAGLSEASSAMAVLEKAITSGSSETNALKGEIGAVKTALDSLNTKFSDFQKELDEIRKASNRPDPNTKAWLSFLKGVVTPQVVITILTIIGSAITLWTQLPDNAAAPKAPPAPRVELPSEVGPTNGQ